MFPSMERRNCRRRSAGSPASSTVSAAARMTVSGVFSSCEALATKSDRTASRRRISVMSTRSTTEPPSVPRFVRTSSSRSPTVSSSRASGRTTDVSRRSRSSGSLTTAPIGENGSTSASPSSRIAAGLILRIRASSVRAISPSATSSMSWASSSRSRLTPATCCSISPRARLTAEARRASSVTPDSLMRGPENRPAPSRCTMTRVLSSDAAPRDATRCRSTSTTAPASATASATHTANRAAASRMGPAGTPRRTTMVPPRQ